MRKRGLITAAIRYTVPETALIYKTNGSYFLFYTHGPCCSHYGENSIGGIELGAPIAPYLSDIYAEGHDVNIQVYDNPGVKLHSYQLDEGVITINTDEAGTILSISCRQPYAGTYRGRLWPGMTMQQARQHTAKQLLTCGALVTDGELGVFFTLPAPYDEFDYPKQLPDELVLETLCVMPRDWRGY